MQYHTQPLGISGTVNGVLRDLIHEQLGLFYESHQFDLLADRLAPLVVAHGLNSFLDYYYLLKYSDPPGEWARLMDALAVNETYFWREIDQLRALTTAVVPELAAGVSSTPLRIWSVPCASGEEPLTLAILLTEAGWFDRVPITIIGSDASQVAIARARQGRYQERAFRNLPPALREKYFTRCENGWDVDPMLARRVSYDIVNLVAPQQVERHATAPMVVCRNVFIYFSDRSIRRVLDIFERCMPARSYLCVGASESLLQRTRVFELQDVGGAFMYVKESRSPMSASFAASAEYTS